MRALTALAKTINELPVKEFRVSFTVYCASKPCKDKNAKTNELDSHPSWTRVPPTTTRTHHSGLHLLCIYCRGAPSAAHPQLALPPARHPLPARPHPPTHTLPTPYPHPTLP